MVVLEMWNVESSNPRCQRMLANSNILQRVCVLAQEVTHFDSYCQVENIFSKKGPSDLSIYICTALTITRQQRRFLVSLQSEGENGRWSFLMFLLNHK